jgi:apolipoprotein N-acyltransferase
MEYLRTLGVFGFTWGTLGYAFLPTPIVQVADFGGVYLVSLLVAASAASLAALLVGSRWPVVVVAALLLAATLYGVTRKQPAVAQRSVLLVQGSVNPLDKASGRSVDELQLYENLSQAGLDDAPGAVDLVIWPEGASPLPISDVRVRQVLASLGTKAIVGAPSYQHDFQNSVYGFDGGITGSYSKRKLVPFGERFPLREPLSFLYDPLFAALGMPGLLSVSPGDEFSPLPLGNITAGTYICYESTFPGVARQMVLRGANLLVNVSNDAWFGRTAGADQHFQMGRVRAIETRRYIARAGNDGITAVIDPLGRVVERFPRGARGAYYAEVGLNDQVTLYVLWGNWVVAVSALALLTLLAPTVIRSGRGR